MGWSRILRGLAVLPVLCLSPAAAQIGYSSYATAYDVVFHTPGVTVSYGHDFIVIEDPATLTVWTFTQPGHQAHPAVVKRQISVVGDNVHLAMEILCEGVRRFCDRLVSSFEERNAEMVQGAPLRVPMGVP